MDKNKQWMESVDQFSQKNEDHNDQLNQISNKIE